MKFKFLLIILLFCSISFAQSTITGSVTDGKQPLPGANVTIAGEKTGTATDFDGKFSLTTQKNPPFTIEVSMIGYGSKKVNITTKNQKVNVSLTEEETKLNEIVISASRTPERVLESPVTIERMSIKEIKNTSSASYYEGLENLKEVHFNTSSLNFKSINTRGFATVANTRFMQLVDGMDNSSPALNFVLGNLIGVSDIDVAGVELMPGASSALYGANAFNGILFMTSKSPFTHQGISAYVKRGVTNHDVAGTNEYLDFGVRAAHAFTKHFAAKANFTYMRATEWIPADDRSITGGSIGHDFNPNYDGLSFYGDEVTTLIRTDIGQVSRTGYREQDLNDNSISNVKFDASLHFKPWNNDFEIIAQHKVGLGNTVYQGANRYRLENFFMQQSRIEFKNRNFFVRGYVSSEDAGDSYDMRFAAWNINRAAKSDATWFGDYANAYLSSQVGLGYNSQQAAQYARNFADNNLNPSNVISIITGNPLASTGQPRLQPGTPAFNNALQTVIANPDLTQGAKFIDRSKIWHADANYNLKELIDFAEIQVGGSFRTYVMNSQGTIFTDFDGPLKYNEYGVYSQIQKKFMEDRLKFTGSVRYDKSQNFEGQFSPRVSLVYSAGEKKNHNMRVSFQTGFRNPTTQDQYIGLDLGPFALIGSAADNLTRFTETINVNPLGVADNGGNTSVNLSGVDAYTRAYTTASVTAAVAANNAALLQKANTTLVKPEQVKAFEAGYKSVLDNGLTIDINGYYNIYNDFMSTARVITPLYGAIGSPEAFRALQRGDRRVYQIYTNTSSEITSYGAGVGLSKKVLGDFEIGANYNYAKFNFDQESDPTFIAGFNTPEHRVKASLGNEKLFKNFGFMVNGRWWSEYEWQSSFADGTIPSTAVLDAQISYTIPSLKTTLKITGSNIGQNDYLQVIGAGRIGQMYMASITYNP